MKKRIAVVLVLLIVATLLSGCAFELPFKVPFVSKLVKHVDPNAPSVVPGLTNRDMKEVSKLSVEMVHAAADNTLFTETDKYKEHLDPMEYKVFKKMGERKKNELPPGDIKIGKPLFLKKVGTLVYNPQKDDSVYVFVPAKIDGRDFFFSLAWWKTSDGKWSLSALVGKPGKIKNKQIEFYNEKDRPAP